MELGLQDVLTVGGAALLVVILMTAIKNAFPFDTARFGALASIGLGMVLVIGANAFAVADIRLGMGEALLTGVLAGATASGLYDAAKGVLAGR